MALDPKKWMPVEAEPLRPGDPRFIPPPPEGPANPYLRTTIPAEMQLQPDMVQHQYTAAIPQIRVMPLQANAKAQINATAQTVAHQVATKIVQQAVAAIPPPVPAVGDGLVHGDAIWELDPACIKFEEDFVVTNSVDPFSSVTGNYPWLIVTPTGGQAFSGAGPYQGGIQFPNSSSATSVTFLLPQNNGANGGLGISGFALFENPSWKFVWNFGLQTGTVTTNSTFPAFSVAQTSLYIGLGAVPLLNGLPSSAGNSPRPPVFCGLRFDTDTTAPAISDTQFVFECRVDQNLSTARNNAQGNTFATGIIPSNFRWYRFEMQCTTAGQVQMTLTDGTTIVSHTLTMPQWTKTSISVLNPGHDVGVVFADLAGSPFVSGSTFIIAGCTGAALPFNGSWVHAGVSMPASFAMTNFYQPGVTLAQTSQGTATWSGYPGAYPWFAFGNDSQASPTAGAKSIIIDRIAYVWNPGVGGGTGTPNSTKPRYW